MAEKGLLLRDGQGKWIREREKFGGRDEANVRMLSALYEKMETQKWSEGA